jgi:hypothetical protein
MMLVVGVNWLPFVDELAIDLISFLRASRCVLYIRNVRCLVKPWVFFEIVDGSLKFN